MPAVCALGIPVLPVEVPGAAVSPGVNSCNLTKAAVLTLDGRGERATTGYATGEGNRMEWVGQVQMPHSLGLLYERVTEYLGFLHSSDEYKVMALASFGKPRYLKEFRDILRLGGRGQNAVCRGCRRVGMEFDDTSASAGEAEAETLAEPAGTGQSEPFGRVEEAIRPPKGRIAKPAGAAGRGSP